MKGDNVMLLLGYLVIGGLILFFLIYISILLIQGEKDKRNPVSLMINHDKRFKDICYIHSHDFDKIERGE